MKQILVFVLFAALLCWFMFAPMYKHVVLVRQAVLQQEVDYMLEVGASGRRGFIDDTAIGESRLRLAERGLNPGLVQYTVTTTSGVNGMNSSSPVLRGTGIKLTIRYPYERLFFIDRLIGITVPSETDTMSATGMKMSEYVP
ncbi:hypothetical protein ACFFK0_07425 [Paenibacillus chartarius]|uniref:Uncharacterized protein n=1 Tax=Paenibacillus chartarius TaxID=747481 RepID=A0ABV6DI20_9BACL